jgi:hypothetical protein
MGNIWAAIGQFEQSQTSIITTLMLVIGGGLGVLLGSWLFGGRVNDLQTALDKSKELVERHNKETQDKLAEMNEQLATTLAALSQLRGAVSDIRADAEQTEEDNAPIASSARNQQRAELKTYWYTIRDELWRRANDTRIHGKTRSRYARFGNNELGDLLGAMEVDENIDPRALKLFREALGLWTWHRNGKAELRDQDVQRMREFKLQLVPEHQS